MSATFEDIIKKTIAESFAEMLPMIAPKAESVPDVMTKKQVAAYFQVSEWTIYSLTTREEYPLPVASVGDNRYFKSEIDQWAKEEAARKFANQRKAA